MKYIEVKGYDVWSLFLNILKNNFIRVNKEGERERGRKEERKGERNIIDEVNTGNMLIIGDIFVVFLNVWNYFYI